jgi:hypothetical protein
MHTHTRGHVVRRDHELEPGIPSLPDLAVAGGTHDDDPRDRKLGAKREPFGHGRHAECGRSGTERGARDVLGAVWSRPVDLDGNRAEELLEGRRGFRELVRFRRTSPTGIDAAKR